MKNYSGIGTNSVEFMRMKNYQNVDNKKDKRQKCI